MAHEALLRGPQGTRWESPAALFTAATKLGHRTILEANARHLAVARLPDLPIAQRLFINIDALSPDMPATPGHREIPPQRLVLEISEQQPILDNPGLLQQVQAWRATGFAIAVDDYGAGYMGLGALLELRPDWLKLDRVITAGVDRDPAHWAAVRNMVELGVALGTTIIAEGVETPAEFWALRECGVRYMQGYLLGRPQEQPRVEVLLPHLSTRPKPMAVRA